MSESSDDLAAPGPPPVPAAAQAPAPYLTPLLIVLGAISLMLFPGVFFATFLIVVIWGGFKECLYGTAYRRADSPETYFVGSVVSWAVVFLLSFLPFVPVMEAWHSDGRDARAIAAYLAICGLVAPVALGLMLLLPVTKGRTAFSIRNLEDGADYRFEYRTAGPYETMLSIRALHAGGAALHLGKSAELDPYVFLSRVDAEGVTLAFQADAKLLRSLGLDPKKRWLNARVLFDRSSDSPEVRLVPIAAIPDGDPNAEGEGETEDGGIKSELDGNEPEPTRRFRVDDLERDLVGNSFERTTAPDALASCLIEGPIDDTCFVVIPTAYRGPTGE